MPLNLTRSILTIFVPGGVAISPWVLFFVVTFPPVANFYSSYPVMVNFVLVGAVIVVGTVFETWGANFEKRWDDEREEEYSVQENWYQYLASHIDPEPVGYRYISRAVTALYFELTMIFASVLFFVGVAAIVASVRPIFSVPIALFALFLALVSRWYFHKQARGSHRLLCKSRKEINARLAAS